MIRFKHTISSMLRRLAPLCILATTLPLAAAEQTTQSTAWIPLFNGKNLDGWTAKFTGHDPGENYLDTFRVEDGVLKVSYDKYDKFSGEFGHLFYKTPFSHYRLRVEYRFTGEQTPGGPPWAFRNSGVMIHSQSPQSMRKEQQFPVSIEVQFLGGDGQKPRPTANLCTPGTHVVYDGNFHAKHCTNSLSDTFDGDQWVTVEVEAHGNETLRHFVNGKQVIEYSKPQYDETDADARELLKKAGQKQLSGGYISLQAESHPVEFRKVELLPLTEPETSGTAAKNLSAPAQKPSILLYIADDMSWGHTGADGDRAVKTPNFDRLAQSGVRFTHAFCASPSCTPSRGALLTGQAVCRLEEGASLLSTLPAKFQTYPDLLEKTGYQVGYSGKGWSPGDYTAGGRSRNPAGPSYKSFAQFLSQLPPGKPFCFWAGSTDPHRPYEAGSGVKSGIDPEKITVPPFLPDTPQMRRDLADYLFEVQRFDEGLGVLLKDLEAAGRLNVTLVVVTSDNGMPYPRAKCNLYDGGTRVPMAVAWPGVIAPNRVVEDFVELTDLAPTFLELAGVARPQEMTARSLIPLLLAKKSGQIDKQRDKVFLARERHDIFRRENGQPVGYPMRALRTRDFLYIRNFKPERIPAGDDTSSNQDNDRGPAKSAVVALKDDPQHKALYERTYGKRPGEELYDLAKDPGQLNNVAGQDSYREVQQKLRTQLEEWMTNISDPRRPQASDPDIFDRYPVHRSPKR